MKNYFCVRVRDCTALIVELFTWSYMMKRWLELKDFPEHVRKNAN